MKKLFKKQMMTIIIAMMIMVAICLIANYLKTYGFSKLFTIKAYKEAFTITAYDKFLIKIFATALELLAMVGCYIELEFNKKMADLEEDYL